MAATSGLDAFFRPRGIAVIGASSRETNLGLRFVRGLVRHRYPGTLCVINRRGEEVEGTPGYHSLEEAPDELDLAIIALRAEAVEDAITHCAAKGVGAAVVFSSGFAEVGSDGARRQQALIERAGEAGVRILGPNCVGFANVLDRVCPMASGFAFRERLHPGALAVIAQSGGVAGLISERAQDHGIGLSHVVATGNEGNITAAEIIKYIVADGRSRAIGVYLEAARDPEGLIAALAAAVDAGMGVAVFKAGSGRQTAAAAAAHTGSIVGDDAGFDAMCRQVGACRVHQLDDVFLVPPIMAAIASAGRRLAVLSTSGGAGVATADACERAGLEFPSLSDETARRLARATPGFSSQQNPVDITGVFVVDMPQFRESLRIMADSEEFGAVILVLTVHPPRLAEEIADAVIAGADPRRLVVMWAAGRQSEPARSRLRDHGFAVSETPTACAAALGALTVGRAGGAPDLRWPAPARGPADARASAILERLAGRGLPVAAMERVASAEEAGAAAERLGFPAVVKADAAELAHKTERGGVVLDIGSRDAARQAFVALARAGLADDGALVQRQVTGARELLVAAKLDPLFGLVLAVGFGGILTEAVARAAVVLPPISVEAMTAALRAAGLAAYLGEFRGEAPLDVGALAGLGAALIEAAAESDGIAHLELNPVVVTPKGAPIAVDALLDLGPD